MPNSPDQRRQGIVVNDMKRLNAFIKAISTKLVVDVGIMGKKNSRKGKVGNTNAEIGFIHEFGRGKIPQRSFLRMPLFLKSEEIINRVAAAGAFQKLTHGKDKAVLTDVGIAAEEVIEEAFESGGYGNWAPDAPSTIARKKGGDSPLIDTGQLRRSIASVVRAP